MEALLGTTWSVFFTVTVVVMGFAAFMTGQALAGTWKPIWQAVFYCLLLGFGDRFLVFSLFDGKLASLSGYLIDTAILIAIALFAYRLTQARKMASQYPWIYERSGLLGWREKSGP
jgi:branched-chain amino acid transport system ATP-binding protein